MLHLESGDGVPIHVTHKGSLFYDNQANNPDFRAKFNLETKAQAEQLGQPFNEEMADYFFEKSLKEIYAKQKDAFDFIDCE